MGCSLSCKRRVMSSELIRVIHLNGYIEEIGYPVTVAEVTGKPTSHFLFTQAQLLAPAPAPLKPDTPLERSRVYFLLPFTLFDANVSPLDLAPIARKLALVAQNCGSKCKLRNKYGEVSNDHKSSKTRPWKPVLSTIRERSFNRRESDVQEILRGWVSDPRRVLNDDLMHETALYKFLYIKILKMLFQFQKCYRNYSSIISVARYN